MNQILSFKILKPQDGSAMLIVLMIMAILSIIGVHSISMSNGESKITTNLHTQKMAFYDADSGVQFALASLENALIAGNANVLPANVGDTVAFNVATPAGFSFEISDIEKRASTPSFDVYSFTSIGYAENAYRDADIVINATFRRGVSSAFTFAAFGDKRMEMKNSGTTQSFDSADPDPTISDPNDPNFQKTGEADVGSNELLITKNNAQIDGDGVIGEAADGTPGTASLNGGTVFTGDAPVTPGRIDPDPLGIDSGGEYDPTSYSAINDNALANYGAGIGTSINLGNGGVITLNGKPGGANYYFTDIILKNGSTLNIDASSGPVNIFIDGGKFDARNGSTINSGGSTLDFGIYANAGDIIMHHGSEFTGVIYAPHAFIDMKNSSDIYGAIWGSEITIRNSGELFYDEALADKYATVSNNLSLISWEEE